MENQSNGKAVASLVLGIVSCVCTIFGIYGGIIGIICGVIAIVLGTKAKKETPSGLATAGFVLGIIGTVLCALMVIACSCFVGGLASSLNSID